MPKPEVKTYRARSLQEALTLVRSDLGNEAAVLRTREVSGGLFGWLNRGRVIEVTASASVRVPSRLRSVATPPPPPPLADFGPSRRAPIFARPIAEAAMGLDLGGVGPAIGTREVDERLDGLQSLAAELRGVGFDKPTAAKSNAELPHAWRRLWSELLAAQFSEALTRELVDVARRDLAGERYDNPTLIREQVAQRLAALIPIAGPIQLQAGRRRLVALVGPTGVGKTTTIAKLAANYRLRENRRVGLITVDTYRIAAVEQLRTYAEIIDVPMEVVSNAAEARAAASRLGDLDLVLLDTAGRSPRDEQQLRELEKLLAAAAPDEVHLVISGTASIASLEPTLSRFAQAGSTAMILTKLDEAHGLGALAPLLRTSKLPLSYLTQGQGVPDDILAADASQLAHRMLGFV